VLPDELHSLFERASKFFADLQTDICTALTDLDGGKGFSRDAWNVPAVAVA
jgi:coproporphyrinogen III oxidase